MDKAMHSEFQVGDRVDHRIGDKWILDYATIIYFDEAGSPICEMNYPGHDGCRWAHKYSFDCIRKHEPKQA